MKNILVRGLAICSTLLAGCFFGGSGGPPNGSTTQGTGATGGGGATSGGGTTVSSTSSTTGTGGGVADGSIVCNGARGVEAGSPWPMEGCCNDRRSRTPLFGPASPRVAWALDLGSKVLTPPVVDDEGWIYVITEDGHLNAVQPDGTLGWAYDFAPSTETRSTPAIGEDGTLYFGAETGIFAVSLNGEKVWRFDAGGDKSAVAIGEDRTVYVYSSNGTLYALGPDGAPRWTLETPPIPVQQSDGKAQPHIAIDAAGLIYIGLAAGIVQTVRSDGTTKMMSAKICPAPVRQLVVSTSGTIYAECTDGAPTLYALNPAGELVWSTHDSGGGVNFRRPAVTSDGGLVLTWQGLNRLSADGDTVWGHSAFIPDANTGLALDGRGFVFAAASEDSSNINFRALRIWTDEGKEFWKHEIDPANPLEPGSSPGAAVVEGIVYAPVGTSLWAFDSK
ncbi:cell surface protein [Minicystis rosea]|nr:cell surface protein [Minicystis rosea]